MNIQALSGIETHIPSSRAAEYLHLWLHSHQIGHMITILYYLMDN